MTPPLESSSSSSPAALPEPATEAQSAASTPTETNDSGNTQRRMGRRQLLRGAGALGAGAALAVKSPVAVRAQEPVAPTSAMRTPYSTAQAALAEQAGALPQPPSLETLAINRIAFGPRPGDWSVLQALGANGEERLQAYVDQQLNPASIDDSACEDHIAGLGFATLTRSRATLWAAHQRPQGIEWQERIRPATETRQATFLRAIHSKRQLVQVLADFWHNHFNVYGWDTPAASTFVHYDRDVIRANVLGNFRTMMGHVAQSPAMLYFLDNISNRGASPNENFARETFELHGMGSENYMGVVSTVGPNNEYEHPAPRGADGRPSLYVDEDVYGATLAFTGWRINEETGAFWFDDEAHHKYGSTVLAQVIPSGSGLQAGNTVLDLLANHPGTANYICRKLCRRFISDNPPQSIVVAAAKVFYDNRNAPDQLKKVMRTILLSTEFKTTWGQKIKRPFDFVISALRATGANYAWSDSFGWRYENMGQALFGWRPPDGYSDRKENWSSTMPMLQRWRMVNWLIDGWRIGGDGANKDDLRINTVSQTPADAASANAIVTAWSNRILWRQLPPEERDPIVQFMAAGRGADATLDKDEQFYERLRFTVALILMSPSFQWR